MTLAVAFLPLRSYAEAPPEVLQAVHTDALHTTYDGSALRLNTRIGLGEYREADPARLIFNLEDKATARVELPDLPAFAFLGKPGDSVWIAPESQDPELIWPGWDTETIAPGALTGDAVDLTLLSATGPGAVEVFFNYDEFTGVAQRVFSSTDPTIRTLHQPIGRHVHANWSFSHLGTYQLTFQANATTTAGAPITSGPVTYTFVVGPYTPPTTPPTTPPLTPPTGTPPTTPPVTPPPSTPPITPPTGTPPVTPSPTPPTTPPTPDPTPPTTHPTTTAPTHPRTSPTPTPSPTPTARPTPPPTSPGTSSGGQADDNSSDSPPNPNPTSTPSGNLPPCITTSTPPITTTPGATTSTSTTNQPGGTTSPGTTPSPTTPSTPPAGADPTRVTLTDGHADYAVRLENNKLTSRIKDGTKPGTPIWRDPAKVTIRLTAAAATRAPGGAFAFLGPEGSPLWQIPQTQKDGVIWLGWNTEELTPAQLSTAVTWRLDRVTGPGNFAVFEFDSFGRPKIIFNSGDGLPDTYRIPLGTHAHGNWSFTKPGTYQATFTHTATLTTGATSTTTSTLTFEVTTTTPAPGGAPHPATAKRNTTSAAASNALAVGASGSIAVADASTRSAQVGGAPRPGVDCRLASTGGQVGAGWVGGGAALVVIGVVVLVATRRRGDV